ncbi:MAG: GNAT family N-acetyltransferase [Myxococcales bacterium]|nr:GNAT family N-acetyltransferase [Myxococcales bacterium]
MSVLELAVDLRCAALARYPEIHLDRPGARDLVARRIDRAYADLEDERVLPGRAVVLLWRESLPWLDDAQRGLVEARLGDDEALAWCAEQLREMAPTLDPSFSVVIDPAHAGVISLLRDTRLQPRMRLLHGPPGRALEGLRSGGIPAETLHGLTVEPFDAPRHLEAIVALLRDVFTERPELGMLPPALAVTPAIQARLDDFSRENLRDESSEVLVVMHGDQVVGQASAHVRQDDLVGRVGGVAIALAPSVRGRGVGKALYEKLLERLVAQDVDLLRGRTANPAVIHLAAVMGRELRGFEVECAG